MGTLQSKEGLEPVVDRGASDKSILGTFEQLVDSNAMEPVRGYLHFVIIMFISKDFRFRYICALTLFVYQKDSIRLSTLYKLCLHGSCKKLPKFHPSFLQT